MIRNMPINQQENHTKKGCERQSIKIAHSYMRIPWIAEQSVEYWRCSDTETHTNECWKWKLKQKDAILLRDDRVSSHNGVISFLSQICLTNRIQCCQAAISELCLKVIFLGLISSFLACFLDHGCCHWLSSQTRSLTIPILSIPSILHPNSPARFVWPYQEVDSSWVLPFVC